MIRFLKDKFIIENTKNVSDAGFTIVEMLVAMTIASVFFASFTAVVIATVQTLKVGDQRTVAQQNARIAVNFLSDEIKQMSELEPLQYSEYRDHRTNGLPRNGECVEGIFGTEVYPIIRRSTDGSDRGYIDLQHADASGGIDEYEIFRQEMTSSGVSDGMPYDIRPLFPNKINFLMNQPVYLPHTAFSTLNPGSGGSIYLDGISLDNVNNNDNSQSADIRVTYEHQKQPPRWGLIPDEGLLKELYLPVFGGSGGGVNLFGKPFVLLRSFQIENITGTSRNDHWSYNQTVSPPYDLVDADGVDSGIDLTRPSDALRQIVADNIVDLRFRYFHIASGLSIEIRYDPYTQHTASTGGAPPVDTNDGYFRYFDHYGQEIFIWADPEGDLELPDPGSNMMEVMEHWSDASPNFWTFMPRNEYERGLLLFEGWRYVNAVMITVKAANPELQQDYFSTTIFDDSLIDSSEPDFGFGFVDFQKGGSFADPLNNVDPLWHALDSYREGMKTGNGPGLTIPADTNEGPFDFVDPNGNAAFDAGRFVTLQTIVSPPILYTTSRQAVNRISFGLSFM